MPRRILVVEDDRLTRRSLALHFTQAGYDCCTASSVAEALALAETCAPNLLILDIGLPEVDGLEGLRLFRERNPALPIIFLSARRRELDQVLGLELGADDYITKPFDIDVLLAHIKAVLRRTVPVDSRDSSRLTTIAVGDLTIDPVAHVVQVQGHEVELALKEFDLLLYLAQNAGAVVSVRDILHHVWGEDWIGEEQTVYVHMSWLRSKLEKDPGNPQRLLTLRGAGYKLMAVEETP